MRGLYTHKFTSAYKTREDLAAAKKFWKVKLYDKNKEQVAKALERMEKEYKDFPPTLPQFQDLFKLTREQALNAGNYDNEPKRIDKPRKRYELGDSPAARLAKTIVTHKEEIKDKPIKIMNDTEWEAYLLKQLENKDG